MSSEFNQALQIVFEGSVIVFIIYLVCFSLFWISSKAIRRHRCKHQENDLRQDFEVLDQAVNDIDADLWKIEKRLDYIELIFKLKNEETRILPDLSEQKRGPGRPKKIEE